MVEQVDTMTVRPALIRRIFDVPIRAATIGEIVEICDGAIEGHGHLQIGVVNAAKLVHMQRHGLLRDSVLQSDIVLADGMAVVWASRILGQPLPERIAGIDLLHALLGLADQKHFGVYFLGASQEILDEVLRRVSVEYPGLRIAGSRNGYFDDNDGASIAEEIRQSNADLLFVGITSPKKEIFLASFGAQLNVPVCHGVGGSFDVIAGKVKRAPQLWQKVGLEWLFRVIQEPRRLWKRYLITNTLFVWMVATEMVRGLRSRASARGS